MTDDAGTEPPGAGTPPVRPTGHDRVDAVLARAAELDARPVAEHATLYDELHAALVAELDAEPGAVPAGLVPGRAAGPGADTPR